MLYDKKNVNEYGVHSDWILGSGTCPWDFEDNRFKVYQYIKKNKPKYNINLGDSNVWNNMNELIEKATEDYCLENKIVKSHRAFKYRCSLRNQYLDWFYSYDIMRLHHTLLCEQLEEENYHALTYDLSESLDKDKIEVIYNPFKPYAKLYRLKG